MNVTVDELMAKIGYLTVLNDKKDARIAQLEADLAEQERRACGQCGSLHWTSSDGLTGACQECGTTGPLVAVSGGGQDSQTG